MTGTRQHFLPRVLLKGFASRMVKDQTYSLVFQNNKEPYEANITRIAVEKEFYTDSVDVDVDEANTAGCTGLALDFAHLMLSSKLLIFRYSSAAVR